jgi:hypothetical protein
MAIAAPIEASEVPNRFEEGTRPEADGYAFDAAHQWHTTPGALQFMFKVFGIKLPPAITT